MPLLTVGHGTDDRTRLGVRLAGAGIELVVDVRRSPYQAAVPAQDRARSYQAMGPQRSAQPPDEGGEDRPVRPVQAWSWVGAAEHCDFVPQDQELDVFGGGRSARQQGQTEHLLEEKI